MRMISLCQYEIKVKYQEEGYLYPEFYKTGHDACERHNEARKIYFAKNTCVTCKSIGRAIKTSVKEIPYRNAAAVKQKHRYSPR